ncbi:hypothetical protein [Enterovibrio norvegicus]|uniref:hypothetical protein n=1 Tax=Enterovibrio norvegicus TaxID=188144 RepID=UPI000CC1C459|nr:hypothetical protein [Enterovibrio norvegicus]PML82012.1 hypothetical protein BCT69_01330 [Enterovibrio norvegicus]
MKTIAEKEYTHTGVAVLPRYCRRAFLISIDVPCSLFTVRHSAHSPSAPFPDQAGTAAAMLGLIPLSDSGIIAIMTQSLGLLCPDFFSPQLWLTLPALIIICSKTGRVLHPQKVL